MALTLEHKIDMIKLGLVEDYALDPDAGAWRVLDLFDMMGITGLQKMYGINTKVKVFKTKVKITVILKV